MPSSTRRTSSTSVSGSNHTITRLLIGAAAAATCAVAYVAPLRLALTTGPSHCFVYRTCGLHCPLCGMTRASVALLRGHVIEAVSLNVLAIPYVAFLAWGLITAVFLGRPQWRRETV